MTARLHVGIDARVLGARGVGRYLSNLLAAFAAQPGDWRITLFLQARSLSALVPQDPRFEALQLGDVSPVLAEQYLIPSACRERGIQVLHFPDNTGAVRPPVPMVLTLHDGMWQRPLKAALSHPSLRQVLQDRYRKWVCPRAAKAAARVITVSDFSARELQATLGLKDLAVIPEGVDPFFGKRLGAAALRQELRNLNLSAPYVLCSGAADRRKNIEGLIRAFARVPALAGAELVVTSLQPQGDRHTRLHYEKVAAACGISGRLRLLAYVSDPQMKALYQGALLYAFPSLWEGFGLPILEAYACGTPVLAAAAGALPETAGRAARLVDPQSEGAIALGLAELASLTPAQRRSRAALGARELKRFSWKRAAEQTFSVYVQAAGRT